jgi:hypothetical protein
MKNGMTEESLKWWPDRENWPTFPPQPPYEIKGVTYIDRLGVEEALALLLLEGYVIPLNGAPKEKEGRCGLCVQCSDVFYSATADAEPLPAVGFVKVTLLGVANPDAKPGVVCASFNAG